MYIFLKKLSVAASDNSASVILVMVRDYGRLQADLTVVCNVGKLNIWPHLDHTLLRSVVYNPSVEEL